jgi:hypothetical protein
MMVTIKFIVEVVLIVITLAVVIWWVYTNYESLITVLYGWIASMAGG